MTTWSKHRAGRPPGLMMAVGALAASLLLAAPAQAGGQRRVAVLHFTAVSCGPCGAAALAMERLKSETGDSIGVVGVHYYDTYQIPEAESLAAHYQIPGTPVTWFDGADVQYYADTATYWNYRTAFDKRKIVAPGAGIALGGWADTSEMAGSIHCEVSNTSAETLAARLRIAVIERAVYRPWGGGDSVFDVLRDMLPGFNGPELVLAPGDGASFDFQFAIQAGWVPGQIEFMAWIEPSIVKDRGEVPFLQSARIGIRDMTGVASGPQAAAAVGAGLVASIHPNPLRDHGLLRFSLEKPGPVRAAFYNVTGRRLGSVDMGMKTAGEHRVELDASRWPRGMVFCLVASPSGKKIVKIIKIH